MTKKATLDQIQHIFTFPFQDQKWAGKFLIGFLLYIAGFVIPFIPWIFVSGYFAKIIEIGINEDELYLPEWDNWGEYFRIGLRLMIFSFIIMLPVFILMIAGYASMLAPAFSSAFSDPAYLDEYPVDMVLEPMLGMFGGMLLMGLASFTGLIVGFFVPPAITHMISEDQFKAAFQIKSWWRVFRGNFGGYLIAYVLVMGATLIMTFAVQLLYMTIILCFAIPLVISFLSIYLGIITGAMFGQNYRVGLENTSTDILPVDVNA